MSRWRRTCGSTVLRREVLRVLRDRVACADGPREAGAVLLGQVSGVVLAGARAAAVVGARVAADTA